MAEIEIPEASASDDGERVSAEPARAPVAPRRPAAPPAVPAAQPAKTLAFERWAVEKFGVAFDARGRASGIQRGKIVTKGGKPVRNATRLAAIVNAARAYHRIPLGKAMTEDEFTAAIKATQQIEVR